MVRHFIVMTLVFGFASAHAYSKRGEFKGLNEQTLKQANEQGLGITGKERVLKAEIRGLKKQNPRAFEEKIADVLHNPPVYQGLLLEVKDESKIPNREKGLEAAKTLAKLTLLNAVRGERTTLENSILNRHAAMTWEEFEYYLKRDLNENTVYRPLRGHKDLNFEALGWGRVSVAANMRSVKYHLDVASHLDHNQLERGAEKIKTDQDSFETEPELEEPPSPITAPIMAEGARKTIVPQIKKSKADEPR